MVRRISQISQADRDYIGREHRGFIRAIARQLDVDHGLVSRVYRLQAVSARVERALLRAVRDFLRRRNRTEPNRTEPTKEGKRQIMQDRNGRKAGVSPYGHTPKGSATA